MKELFWFQLLGRCLNCKIKVSAKYTGGMFPYCFCSECGWGEE